MGDVGADEHALGVLGDESQYGPHRAPPDDVMDGQLVERVRLDSAGKSRVVVHREGAVELYAEVGHPDDNLSRSSAAES